MILKSTLRCSFFSTSEFIKKVIGNEQCQLVPCMYLFHRLIFLQCAFKLSIIKYFLKNTSLLTIYDLFMSTMTKVF